MLKPTFLVSLLNNSLWAAITFWFHSSFSQSEEAWLYCFLFLGFNSNDHFVSYLSGGNSRMSCSIWPPFLPLKYKDHTRVCSNSLLLSRFLHYYWLPNHPPFSVDFSYYPSSSSPALMVWHFTFQMINCRCPRPCLAGAHLLPLKGMPHSALEGPLRLREGHTFVTGNVSIWWLSSDIFSNCWSMLEDVSCTVTYSHCGYI